MAQLRWLGTAGIEVASEGQVLLVDPYFSRVSLGATLFSRLRPSEPRISDYLARMPGTLTAIAVGHTHFDHVMDVPTLVAKTGAPAFGSRSLKNLLGAAGVGDRVVEVERGATYRAGPFELAPIVSRHGRTKLGTIRYPGHIAEAVQLPLRVGGYRHGLVLGWEVAVEGRRLLHLGSADFIDSALAGHEVDAVVVCAVGRQTRPAFTKDLLAATRPARVVPIHFDNFWARELSAKTPQIPGVDVLGFEAEIRAAAPATEILIPSPYEPIEI